jgi:serine/threonine protein kinase/tetratricopeptide (TPR) repeat protein
MSPAIDPSRDLLFGFLALQNGLIDQVQLVAAFQAWTRNKSTPLADHLIHRGDIEPDDRVAVDALVSRHIKKHGGDVEKSLAAVSAGKSTRERLAALADPALEATLSHVGSGSAPTDGDADRTRTYQVGTATSDGQRFRVLRPHARGGLGAVFVALDSELNREVALKQILEGHEDDPVSRQRFLLEAEITGGLEHPGIVPVYGLGTYGDGRPYYAMRFVRGDSLKEAIERFHKDESLETDPGRRSLELRKLLRRFTDVCNAIEYAHSRGVQHRDIKPGNVIVGKHGETLVVDWGLAKALGHTEPGAGSAERTLMPSSASGSAETLPGQALGTPAYMSPEQARGDLDRLGPCSDVYSLGATLYCLLTGKAPFEGEMTTVLRAVERGAFVPPRVIDPAIDKALEAICLKAMASRPEERYASCRPLAEDVERWMADESVSAWREPRTRALLRWLTRHRTGVTGAAAAMLAGVVGLVAVLAVQSAANARLSASLVRETRAKDDLAAANADLARSNTSVQERYDLAVEAIKTVHTGVSEDFLLGQDQFREQRDRLLTSAAAFYGKLSRLLGKETDLASRAALARSNFELAELTGKVGRLEDALAAHRAVLSAREALASERGAAIDAQADVTSSLLGVGRVLTLSGRSDEALPALKRALAILEHIGAARADPERDRDERARAHHYLGDLHWSMGRFAEAAESHGKAAALWRELADAHPQVMRYRRDQARSDQYRGMNIQAIGRLAEAEAIYRQTLTIQQRLVSDHPTDLGLLHEMSQDHNRLGDLLSLTGKTAEAEAEYRAALEVQQRLADDTPAVAEFRRDLADCHVNLGWLLAQTGKPTAAESEYRAALAMWQKLTDDNPKFTYVRDVAGNTANNLSVVLRRLGRAAEALEHIERAVAARQALVDEFPGVTRYRTGLAENYLNRGLVRRSLGDPAGAVADIRQAIAMYQALTSLQSEPTFLFAGSHAALAGLSGQPGSGVSAEEAVTEAEEAIKLLRKAVDMGYGNPAFYRTEDALDPLRDREDFRALMAKLEGPAGP